MFLFGSGPHVCFEAASQIAVRKLQVRCSFLEPLSVHSLMCVGVEGVRAYDSVLSIFFSA